MFVGRSIMSNKFERVPVEEDTTILSQQEAKLGEYDVLHQRWYWDGIIAECIIFANEDIVSITDDEVETEVRMSPLVKADSKITLKRSKSGFTFVNFNFEDE